MADYIKAQAPDGRYTDAERQQLEPHGYEFIDFTAITDPAPRFALVFIRRTAEPPVAGWHVNEWGPGAGQKSGADWV